MIVMDRPATMADNELIHRRYLTAIGDTVEPDPP